MENLYKVDEYSGKLPNPKHFPVRDASIIAIKDRPNAFADGFMVDLFVREADKEMLKERANRTVDVSSQLGDAKVSNLLLSGPEFIYDTTYPTYIVFTPGGNPVPIQVKYYKYFTNRYLECSFYIREEGSLIITAKVNKEVIGLCMSMFFERTTLAKIKEERK